MQGEAKEPYQETILLKLSNKNSIHWNYMPFGLIIFRYDIVKNSHEKFSYGMEKTRNQCIL